MKTYDPTVPIPLQGIHCWRGIGQWGTLHLFILTQRHSSWLLMGVIWIHIPSLKNEASIMVLFRLVDWVWIGSLHAW